MPTTSTKPVRVFFAYAHEDEEIRDELAKHLATMTNRKLIELWHDRKLEPGVEWDSETKHKLMTADIVVPLISADFLNSEYCMDIELRGAIDRARRGEARVVPIIVRPTLWRDDERIASLLVLPTDGKPIKVWDDPELAYCNVAEGIRRVVERMNAPAAGQGRTTAAARTTTPAKGRTPTRAGATGAAGASSAASTSTSTAQVAVASAADVAAVDAGPSLGERLRARVGDSLARARAWLSSARTWRVLFVSGVSAVAGGLATFFGLELVLSSQGTTIDAMFHQVATGGSAVGAGLIAYVLQTGSRSGSAAMRALEVKPNRRTVRADANPLAAELHRTRAMLAQTYERKELYKAAFFGALKRANRRIDMIAVAVLVGVSHLVAAFGQSVMWERYDVVERLGDAARAGTVSTPMLQLGSVLLVCLTFVVSALVVARHRRRLGAVGGLWTAIVIGGIGSFLGGALFLVQLSPELLDLIGKTSGSFSVVPGFDIEGLKVSWLTSFFVQKLALLPIAGVVGAVLASLVVPLRREASLA